MIHDVKNVFTCDFMTCNLIHIHVIILYVFPGSRCMLQHTTQPAEFCCDLPSSKDLRVCLEAVSSANSEISIAFYQFLSWSMGSVTVS